jgi:hypothetical protein
VLASAGRYALHHAAKRWANSSGGSAVIASVLVGHVEALREEGHAELLAVGAVLVLGGRPAQQRDEVVDDLRQVARGSEVLDRHLRQREADGRRQRFELVGVQLRLLVGHPRGQRRVAERQRDGRGSDVRGTHRFAGGLVPLALGHLRALVVEDEGHVRVHRRGHAQRPLQRHVLWRVGQVLLAAEDVRHAHQRVIDDDREVVGGVAVLLADDKVFQLAGFDADLAEHRVVHDDRLVVGRAEADHVRLAGGHAGPALGLGDAKGRPVVAVGALLGQGGGPLGGQLLSGFEGWVGVPGLDQPVDVLVVQAEAFGLPERADVPGVAADVPAVVAKRRALVPVDAKPRQIVQDALCRRLGRARLVGVLQTHQEAAARGPGEGPAEEGRAGTADVQVA